MGESQVRREDDHGTEGAGPSSVAGRAREGRSSMLPDTVREDAPNTSKRSSRRSPDAKLEVIFDALKEVDWSLGDFLYYLFRVHNERGERVRRSGGHGSMVGRFLSGRSKYTAAHLIGFWLEDALGWPKQQDPEFGLRYSPDVPWKTIKHASVAITAMGVQLCKARLVREQRAVVKGANGLHGSGQGLRGRRELRWEDISKSTVTEVHAILKKHQPLSLHLIEKLATPSPRKNDAGTILPRRSRPPALVCIA